MNNVLAWNAGDSTVTIAGLSAVDEITCFEFDGITVTLNGAAAETFGDLTVGGGSARRIIWNGKVNGVERDCVLIVDTFGSGKLRGAWLIFGDEQNHLTYYPDASKLTAQSTGSIDDDAAAISLTFVDRNAALKPRTFTFMEKYSLLSLGSAFDHVTINAHDDVYLSRSQGTIISGVIKGGSSARIDCGQWAFDNEHSFVIETADNAVHFYKGGGL